MSTVKKTDVLKSLFFILYFAILTTERSISLVSQAPLSAVSLENLIVTVTVILSLIAGWGYLLIRGRAIFKLTGNKSGGDFLQPSIAAGLLLISGMIHTRGTISPVQFVAYGFLLAAMGIYTAECVKAEGKGDLRWSAFAYITAFSMSIPVIYGDGCGCRLCAAFSVTEIVVCLGLIACFTVMLYNFFKNGGIDGFNAGVILFAAAGDGAVLFLRWHREINFFLLGAITAAVICFIVGKVFSTRGNAKNL